MARLPSLLLFRVRFLGCGEIVWLFVGFFAVFSNSFFFFFCCCCCCRFNSSVSSGSSCYWCCCPLSTLGVATYTNASHTHAHAHTDCEFVRRRKEKIIQPPTIKATEPQFRMASVVQWLSIFSINFAAFSTHFTPHSTHCCCRWQFWLLIFLLLLAAKCAKAISISKLLLADWR